MFPSILDSNSNIVMIYIVVDLALLQMAVSQAVAMWNVFVQRASAVTNAILVYRSVQITTLKARSDRNH